MGNRGSKSLGHGFWTKHDVIVAIATACATMATHWVCGEFDAESCGCVKTVVLRGIRGQNCFSIFCPLVHVLPTAYIFVKLFTVTCSSVLPLKQNLCYVPN